VGMIFVFIRLCLVDGGHRAVIFNKFTGVRPKVYGEGTHLRIPFFDVPIIYDVRAKPRSVQSLTGSRGKKKPSRVGGSHRL